MEGGCGRGSWHKFWGVLISLSTYPVIHPVKELPLISLESLKWELGCKYRQPARPHEFLIRTSSLGGCLIDEVRIEGN